MLGRKFVFLNALFALLAVTSSQAKDEGFSYFFDSLDPRVWYVSNGWANGDHQSCEWRADALSIDNNTLKLTLSDRGGKIRPIGCPEIHTNQRLWYGFYEARMRTAAGSGLNTAFFTYIGPPNGVAEHDEIDFEFLGKAPDKVEINYFANGKFVRGKVIDLGFDASQDFHDYAFDWTASGIQWFVDHKKVFETIGEVPIPRNPSFLFFSLWSGSAIEDSWMGPFLYKSPVTAAVAWTRFTPKNKI
jgi:endo-1,3-1,4-beta-glycanase ExoK